MMSSWIAQPLIPIVVIVVLSLIVAYVLFAVLESTGVLRFEQANFGGAAAGFFFSLWVLKRWYDNLYERYLQHQELAKTVADLLAKEVVRAAGDDKLALTAQYSEMLQYIPVQFKSFDDKWRNLLLTEFQEQIMAAIRTVSGLSGWEPPEAPQEVALVLDIPVAASPSN